MHHDRVDTTVGTHCVICAPKAGSENCCSRFCAPRAPNVSCGTTGPSMGATPLLYMCSYDCVVPDMFAESAEKIGVGRLQSTAELRKLHSSLHYTSSSNSRVAYLCNVLFVTPIESLLRPHHHPLQVLAEVRPQSMDFSYPLWLDVQSQLKKGICTAPQRSTASPRMRIRSRGLTSVLHLLSCLTVLDGKGRACLLL